MVPLLITLLISIGTTFYPEVDWDRIVARATVSLLKKGMTETQVNDLLGSTLYTFRASSLGGSATYPAYHLYLYFSYTGKGLLSAHFTRYEATSPSEGRFRCFEELRLRE